ncbi:hypothetical protein [Streptomonospora salina]|uniref:PASTA domain-containing protein n=1 Tax=Streptomonospora salina TaxID=104205 RepID=A0A841EG87_9ACTN|nr:hypothetical protein [Streptomonospora salina]MBB6000369.1 hypothetical protein [Streptomonospora salina]
MRHRNRVDPLIAELRPRVGASEELDPARPAARELLASIVEEEQEPTVAPNRTTRRLLIAVPAAAALAAGAVAATALMPTSAPGPVAPQEAAALEIDVEDGLVVAEVKDPAADPERYAEEFSAHGLDVDLKLVPASPTQVGTLTYMDQNMSGEGTDDRDVEVIESPENCTPNGVCPVGVRIPEDYGNTVELAFGRVPKDDEKYRTTNSPTAPGEALEGVDIVGMTVAEAKDVLADHDQRVAEYRVRREQPEGAEGTRAAPSPSPGADASSQPPAEGDEAGSTVVEKAEDVPGDHYVRDVSLWAPGEVMLKVDETPK